MNHKRLSPTICLLLMLAAIVFWLVTGFTLAEAATPPGAASDSGPALALRAKHQSLRASLAANPFARPLVLESRQNARDVDGEIYAVVPYPFAKVSASLAGPEVWCDILSLHQNTKYCGITRERESTSLLMNVGKKVDQPLKDSYRLAFAWQVAEQSGDFLRVNLTADSGPLGTRDYRITLEAIPLENGTTFLHLYYSYGFSLTSKMAMQAYLATVGRNKVGFSVTGKTGDGQQVYVDGMRGLVERNTMRYYLAIESFLGALAVPERARFEKRINDWFVAVERYSRQLHEMEREDYLSMKRREYRRQQASGKLSLVYFA
jgi:hypothetical protein